MTLTVEIEFMAASIHNQMRDYWHVAQDWDEISESWRDAMRAAVAAAVEGAKTQ